MVAIHSAHADQLDSHGAADFVVVDDEEVLSAAVEFHLHSAKCWIVAFHVVDDED